MDRSECYGTCPSYTVKVFSDGRVAWNGRRHVKVRGEQLYRIPEADARRLLQKFKTARVWRLREQYERSVTDNPTVVVEISIGGRRKRISDYAASAPAWFRALQTGIDETAATAPFRQPDPGAGRP